MSSLRCGCRAAATQYLVQFIVTPMSSTIASPAGTHNPCIAFARVVVDNEKWNLVMMKMQIIREGEKMMTNVILMALYKSTVPAYHPVCSFLLEMCVCGYIDWFTALYFGWMHGSSKWLIDWSLSITDWIYTQNFCLSLNMNSELRCRTFAHLSVSNRSSSAGKRI